MNVLFLLNDTGMHERLGIMQLSSILKERNRGHKVKLIVTEKLSEEELIEQVREFNPGVIGYSVMTGEHGYYVQLNPGP